MASSLSSSNFSKSSSSTAAASGNVAGREHTSREGTAKATVVDSISQAVQSTSNLLHLMQQSSPSQAHLIKLPKNLLAKTSTIKNTAQVLEHLPRVISSLDAHMESGLHSAPHLKTVIQLLSNMENSQLKSAFLAHRPLEETEAADKLTEAHLSEDDDSQESSVMATQPSKKF